MDYEIGVKSSSISGGERLKKVVLFAGKLGRAAVRPDLAGVRAGKTDHGLVEKSRAGSRKWCSSFNRLPA